MSTKQQRAAASAVRRRLNSYNRFAGRVSRANDPMDRLWAAQDFLSAYLKHADARDRRTVADQIARLAHRTVRGTETRSRNWTARGLARHNTPEVRAQTAYRLLRAHLKTAEPYERRTAAKALVDLAEKVARGR